MKGLLAFLLILVTALCEAQDLNNYKYVIVDNQYDFQQEPNEYRLNEMMVFEIKKREISAFLADDVLPNDLNETGCNALSLKVETRSGLRVKMIFEFVNCKGITVFETKEGIGRTKNFEKAYREAIRDAMTSLDGLNYSYAASLDDRPSGIETPIQVMQPSAVKPSLEITPSNGVEKDEPQTIPRPEMVELIDDEGYTTNSKEYKIHSTDSGYNMYKNNSLIGTLKKSASGCYLTVTTEFIGIGYKKENTIIIEYDKNGTQFLVFQKK